jgi:uncharacterized membrane protein
MNANFQWAFGIFTAAMALVVGVLFHKIPEWTRPDIFFSVTVPPEFRATPEARQILKSYRVRVWLAVLVSFAAIFAGTLPSLLFVAIVGEILLVTGSLAAFLAARKRVLPHAVAATGVRVAALAPRPAHLPGGWIAQAGPFAILFATALWLRAHWSAIPERFPIHWDGYGNANGWATRSVRGVYGPLILEAALLAILAVMAYGILTRSRRVGEDADARGHGGDFMKRMLEALLILEYAMALLFAFIGALPIIGQPGMPLTFAIVTIFMAGVCVVIARLSRARPAVARSAMHTETAAESFARGRTASTVGDGTPDANWKWGVIYYNPQDAALFVEKRFGIGYTLNFGRPVAWLLIVMIVVVPLAIATIVTRK